MHTRQKFYVNESSYSPLENIIKNISGYGFTNEGEQFLDILILELEYEFISIKSSPVVLDIKISKEFPKLSEYDELLF